MNPAYLPKFQVAEQRLNTFQLFASTSNENASVYLFKRVNNVKLNPNDRLYSNPLPYSLNNSGSEEIEPWSVIATAPCPHIRSASTICFGEDRPSNTE